MNNSKYEEQVWVTKKKGIIGTKNFCGRGPREVTKNSTASVLSNTANNTGMLLTYHFPQGGLKCFRKLLQQLRVITTSCFVQHLKGLEPMICKTFYWKMLEKTAPVGQCFQNNDLIFCGITVTWYFNPDMIFGIFIKTKDDS